jgi:hypothetical protein
MIDNFDNNKLSPEEMYTFSYYAYLDLIYESILEKDGYISKEKLEKFLKLPGIFPEIFCKFLNDRENFKERKEFFLEYCFIFFNPYLLKDEILWAGMMYNLFRSKEENLLFSNDFISIIDNLLLNFFIKSNENNFEFIYSSLIRINMMIKIAFKNEAFFTFDRFINIINRNIETMEVIQFIFYSVSPLYRKVINNIKELLLENDYDYIDSQIKLKVKKKFLPQVFEKIQNNEDTDYDELMEENDETSGMINDSLNYDFSIITKQKNEANIKKIGIVSKLSMKSFEESLKYDDKKLYKKEYIINNLFKINNDYTGHKRENFKSVYKFLSRDCSSILNRSNLSEYSSNLEMEYYSLGEKKNNVSILKYINDFNGDLENNTLCVFSDKYLFNNINKYMIDSILISNYDKINDYKNNNKNDEINCFYHKERSILILSDLNRNKSKYFYKLKIIDGNVIFFKKDEFTCKLVFNRIMYENHFNISKIEFNYENKDLIIITLKDSEENYHNFIFSNIETFDKFIYLLIINKQLSYEINDDFITRVFQKNKYLDEYDEKEKIAKFLLDNNKNFLKGNYLKEFYKQINEVININNLMETKEIKDFFDTIIILSNKFKKF